MSSLEHSLYFEALLQFFYRRTGIFFNEKRGIVAQRVEDFFRNEGLSNPADYVRLLESDETLYQRLINLLTVNETYFFREARALEIFAAAALEKGSRIRVLCVPCSSGEEAYTLSMLLLGGGMDASRFEIVGIDINSEVIKEAKAGIYGLRSLYRTPDEVKERYFESVQEGFVRVKPPVTAPVRFERCNLFESCFRALGEFDYVFCRNLLIYFDAESRLKAEKALYERMKPGALLFTGHADLIKNETGLVRHFDHGTLYYERPSGR